MEQLIADLIYRMGLALPVTILVAVSAGKVIHTINSLNLETQINNLTVDVIKEMIVDQLDLIYRVYRDTTPDVNHLPAAVNFHSVAEQVLFSVDNIHWQNNIYMDLLNRGTQSEYFLQVLQFLG